MSSKKAALHRRIVGRAPPASAHQRSAVATHAHTLIAPLAQTIQTAEAGAHPRADLWRRHILEWTAALGAAHKAAKKGCPVLGHCCKTGSHSHPSLGERSSKTNDAARPCLTVYTRSSAALARKPTRLQRLHWSPSAFVFCRPRRSSPSLQAAPTQNSRDVTARLDSTSKPLCRNSHHGTTGALSRNRRKRSSCQGNERRATRERSRPWRD